MPEERKISPAVAIIPIALGGVAIAGLAVIALAEEEPPPDAVPEVGVSIAWQSDPEFTVGSTHNAKVAISNPTPWGWTYIVGLILGGVTLDTKEVSVSGGGSKVVTFTVSFPNEGTYSVVIDVAEETTETFLGSFPFEPVVVVPEAPEIPDVEIVSLTWE